MDKASLPVAIIMVVEAARAVADQLELRGLTRLPTQLAPSRAQVAPGAREIAPAAAATAAAAHAVVAAAAAAATTAATAASSSAATATATTLRLAATEAAHVLQLVEKRAEFVGDLRGGEAHWGERRAGAPHEAIH